MNEQEIREILELFEQHGWSPRLCDTPVLLENNAIRAGLPEELGKLVRHSKTKNWKYLPLRKFVVASWQP